MNQDFPHFYIALDWLLEYYELYRIEEMFEAISEKGVGGANKKNVIDSFDMNFRLQVRMQTEMEYTILNTYPPAQLLHLELFKSWMSDYRIVKTNELQVLYVINSYNERLLEKYHNEVKEKEEQFRSTSHYQLEPGAEYTTTEMQRTLGAGLGLLGYTSVTVTKKNTKFFSAPAVPKYIDTTYFNEYISYLDKAVTNFRNILKKYVDLYNENKLPQAHQVIVSIAPLPPPADTLRKELPQPLYEPTKKIETTLTVEQIGYLFKMLHDEGIIKSSSYKEIHEFISRNFTAKSKNESEPISIGKLGKVWSNFGFKNINYWIDKFIDLHKRAKKDNPNSIKPKN